MENFGWPFIVTVTASLAVAAILWGVTRMRRRFSNQSDATPEPTPPAGDDTAMQLLKALREQIRGKSGYTVVASEPATNLSMKVGSHELDRCLHNLIRAGYLNESSKPMLTAQYVYQITPSGIDAADAYEPRYRGA
jgi:hypothetical protein